MITFDFTGKTAIVTGGTRGIGAEISRSLLKAGADVTALFASNQQAADDFMKSLPNDSHIEAIKCDVADYDAVNDFFEHFDKAHNNLEILVHCAGIRRDGVLAMMPHDNWDAVINTNLGGCFSTFKLATQRMLPNRYGRLIAISSLSGKIGIQGQANYAASKAGMTALVKSLSREVARRKITVNCVSPGFIDTDFIASLPQPQTDAYKNSVPMRRFGTPQEVANTVLFLASEEASYITGSVIEVSGGI